MSKRSEILTLTDNNFHSEVLESEIPVIVLFQAEWCGNAHIMAPVIEEIAEDYGEKIKIGKMNLESNHAIPRKYCVGDSLTLLLIKDGQVVCQIMNAVSKKYLENQINRLLVI